jgi:hypothetical protein
MKKYSIKKYRNKGRNINKYKKSRRGRGKRSLIGGKTRRYKVFKNTKRHTLGKRKGRRMVGGVEPWTFRVNPESLKKYVNSKYRTSFSHLTLVAFGYVGITNTSKGYFLRADHRLEKVAVFACYENDNDQQQPTFYVIARCTKTCHPKVYTLKDKECPNFNMEEKILFFTPQGLNITYPSEGNLDVTSDKKTQKAVELLRKKLEEKYTEERVNKTMNSIMIFEFVNTISSSDNYRIVIFPYANSETLKPFFSSVKSEHFIPTNVEYPDQQQMEQQPSSQVSDSSAEMGFFALLVIAILNELK